MRCWSPHISGLYPCAQMMWSPYCRMTICNDARCILINMMGYLSPENNLSISKIFYLLSLKMTFLLSIIFWRWNILVMLWTGLCFLGFSDVKYFLTQNVISQVFVKMRGKMQMIRFRFCCHGDRWLGLIWLVVTEIWSFLLCLLFLLSHHHHNLNKQTWNKINWYINLYF